MRESIMDDPRLERDIQDTARTPNFRRLKRHVFAAFSEGSEAECQQLADDIADALKESLMDFDPESGA